MASRFSAARPKRAGETYARQHHHAAGPSEPDSKKVKFDVRNPSALAPDAGDVEDDEDARDVFLEADADVIGKSAATKRGAVNIDGYDSDSDREELGTLHTANFKREKEKNKDADMDDMFAADDGEDEDAEPRDDTVDPKTGKKSKEVRFMSTSEIQGQEAQSKSGGHIHIDADAESSSDDDDEAIALAIQEEDVDEEVGAGGRKKHAPKLEAFNLKQENEEGRFDEAGNFVRKAADPDAVHDRWLEGLSKKDMRRAAEAHERREAEARLRRREEDSALTADLLRALILHLERGETALEALARLGRAQNKGKSKVKKVPKWKQKKRKQADAMDVDEEGGSKNTGGEENGEKGKEKEKEAEDPEQARIKDSINAITDAADKLLGRDRPDIYDRERERLIREYVREADEEWVEPEHPQSQSQPQQGGEANGNGNGNGNATGAAKMWEYRWTDGRDGAGKQGPFDGNMMKAWQDAGYFGEGVEFREVGDESWSRAVDFV